MVNGLQPGLADQRRAEAPAVRVLLSSVLLALFPGASRRVDLAISEHGMTVAAVIDALDARWPGMADRIRDSRPAIRRHINIYVGGRRAKLETAVPPGAEVIVLTAISGG